MTKPLDMFWFIPVSGDGTYLGTRDGARAPDFSYLKQIAQAADQLGFKGALLPTGRNCDDPWITAAALATHTERLKFLLALRPAIISPSYAARQTAAFDRISNGRFIVNVVTGGNPKELAGDGVHHAHDERYHHTAEFLSVYARLLEGKTVNYTGKFIDVRDAKLEFAPVQSPRPPIWFGGSSDVGIDVAAEHADVYLTWGEPLPQVAAKLDQARARAKLKGRKLTFGLRMHLIVRETDEAAWRAADKLISKLPQAAVDAAQAKFRTESDSVGQSRMADLHHGDRSNLVIAPNLWAGIGLVRGGAGTALVGSPQTVAARLREYQALGVDTIIASGYPHLEESYRVAELLFPELGLGKKRAEGVLADIGAYGGSGTGYRVSAS